LWSHLSNSDHTEAKHREAEKDPACSFSHDEIFFKVNKVMGEKFLTNSNTGMVETFTNN
jgi:hypothetical protein